MNKAELIDKISKDAEVTKAQANAALDSFTDTVIAALKKGDRVTLVFATGLRTQLRSPFALSLKIPGRIYIF